MSEGASSNDPARVYSFEQLVHVEDAWLKERGHRKRWPALKVEVPGSRSPTPIDEPWVKFTNRDLFGVALSGGGMRSAAFNLGLLQALGQRGVLEHVDYLSTVSGGGYIGGFWSACQASSDATVKEALGPRTTEPKQIRHLREFSRFLVPRIGFIHAETWTAIMSVLGGMIPALLTTTALVGIGVYAWAGLAWALFAGSATVATVVFVGAMLAQQIVTEFLWSQDKAGPDARASAASGYTLGASFGLIPGLAFGLWRAWPLDGKEHDAVFPFFPKGDEPLLLLLAPSVVLCASGLLALLLRALVSRRTQRLAAQALERAASRCFAPAIVWAAGACIWWAAHLIQNPPALGATAAGAATSGGLFVIVWEWLRAEPKESNASRLLGRLGAFLKPLLPQVLAAVGAVCLIVLVTALTQRFACTELAVYETLGVYAVILGVAIVSFDPAVVGLHDFYRSRIARCFIGAAHVDDQGGSRPTEEQTSDVVKLTDLKRSTSGPIHLVCCAANNLGGDVLSNLYRGARSAALSAHAVSIGGFAAHPGDLTLSAALTASAAAFNSQMGGLSLQLGPSVAFLMTALNLRLGLWVPHPLSGRAANRVPTLYFAFEAAGYTRCTPVAPQTAEQLLATADPKRPELGLSLSKVKEMTDLIHPPKSLHLSDGGHFENLGLYELVRRHCRYIIVSDATADPSADFDDLANAIRRVREDFSVEIDLDVDPLRPVDGVSKQHAVVGTIHYDGFGGTDKGTLIYFKPTLIGDEPADVTQYRARNDRFPHESTGDQFYDEAQWESYRRLGEHEAAVVLRFLNRGSWKASFIDGLFTEARQLWHAAPAGMEESFLELTNRCSEIESQVRDDAPPHLRAEFFPEAGLKPPQPSAQDDVQTLYFLMQAVQVMEDAWLAGDLDVYWSHPLNEGWMSYFHRWAATPSFRKWWPVLRPIYSAGFRDFVRDRFDVRVKDASVRDHDPDIPGARLRLTAPAAPARGIARDYWERRWGPLRPQASQRVLQYELTLDDAKVSPLQVGLLLWSEKESGVAQWDSKRLFVPPALIGGGIVARFLDSVLSDLRRANFREVRVSIDQSERDPASRTQQLNTVSFYKSRGFIYDSARELRLELF